MASRRGGAGCKGREEERERSEAQAIRGGRRFEGWNGCGCVDVEMALVFTAGVRVGVMERGRCRARQEKNKKRYTVASAGRRAASQSISSGVSGAPETKSRHRATPSRTYSYHPIVPPGQRGFESFIKVSTSPSWRLTLASCPSCISISHKTWILFASWLHACPYRPTGKG